MERHLKERLVGAVVIVIIGVIVIPWLLDGPDESATPLERSLNLPPQAESQGRRVTIPVGGSPQTPTAQPAPPPVTRVRPEAGSVRRPAEGADPAQTPPPRQPETAEKKPGEGATAGPTPDTPAVPPRPAADPGDGWAVQVGSFSQQANATRLRARLEEDGFKAYLSRVVTDAGTMHRVRVGPVADRAAADELVEKLSRAGQKGRVVPAAD